MGRWLVFEEMKNRIAKNHFAFSRPMLAFAEYIWLHNDKVNGMHKFK